MITVLKNPSDEAKNDVLDGRGFYLAPAQAHIRAIEEDIIAGGRRVIWGDILFTPETLIGAFARPEKRPVRPLVERAVVFDILSKRKLRYFDVVKNELSVGLEFARAIGLLRKNLISADELERDMAARGSLREFDLLTVYKCYEDRLAAAGLADAGARLAGIVDDISSFDWVMSVIISGYEIIPPLVSKLASALERRPKPARIEIADDPPPESGIYAEFAAMREKALAAAGAAFDRPEREEGNWRLPALVEFHNLSTPGNECRYICEEIARHLGGGRSPDGIGVVVQEDAAHGLIHMLKEYNVIPRTLASGAVGQIGRIRDAIRTSASAEDLTGRLANDIAPRLAEMLERHPCLPQIAANLRQIEEALEGMFYLEGMDMNFDTVRNILLSETAPGSHAEGGDMPFRMLRWGEGLYPPTGTLAVPSAYQGGTPPESPSPIFFQDARFREEAAPLYFPILFPQADACRAREAYRFRKYLMSAEERVVLTCPRMSRDGKETCPPSITALISAAQFDERRRAYPAAEAKGAAEEAERRASNEEAAIKRPLRDPPSAILEEKNRAAIRKALLGRRFSATSLEKYARCPYSYYLAKVMGLGPIEPPAPEIRSRHRGTIIHRALELFFREGMEALLKFIRNEIAFSELAERLRSCLDASLSENAEYLEDAHPAMIRLFRDSAMIICRRAVEFEVELIGKMKYPLLPAYTEWRFGEEGLPALVLGGTSVKAEMHGVVDRIDVDPENGTFSITDYKTGKTDAVIAKIREGEHLQLPIYVAAARELLLPGKKPAGAFLFSLRKMEKKHGLAVKGMKNYYFPGYNPKLFVQDAEFDELIGLALDAASSHAEKIMAAEFPENTENCGNSCDYREICRYAK